MKKLLKRLLHMVHSPQYSQLVSETQSPHVCKLCHSRARSSFVQDGYLPVYVGREMQRYIISTELVNHPIFVELLNRSAQEYGYEGLLRIHCEAIVFERVLEALQLGKDDSVRELVNFL